MRIVEILESKIVEVQKAIAFAKAMLKFSPKGTLQIKKSNGKTRYYERIPGTTKRKYLNSSRKRSIKDLEEKNYFLQLIKTGTEEKTALEKAEKILNSMPEYESVFLKLSPEARHLISPYDNTPEKDTYNRVFEKKPVPKELKLITQNGEHVRSKSELILADRLKSAGVTYYYEDPVKISGGKLGSWDKWNPDFRVLNKRTGKQYFWEHFGMLDKPDYCAYCLEKLEIYAQNGYCQGENLIITSESSAHGLNLEYVDFLIEKYLK